MIEAALSFARNEAEVEKPATLDLAVLLQTVCEEAADAGASAEYLGAAHAACFGRPPRSTERSPISSTTQ